MPALNPDHPRSDAGTDEGLPAEDLVVLVYGELRRLASAKLAREATGQTLQPTALVHEAWLRLGDRGPGGWKNQAHFFAAAAESMRRILIERARRRRAVKHGGELARAAQDVGDYEIASPAEDEELLLVHDALAALEAQDARRAQLVKQHYFIGLSFVEIAKSLGLSERTIMRDWEYARAWLSREVKRLRG